MLKRLRTQKQLFLNNEIHLIKTITIYRSEVIESENFEYRLRCY